MKQNIYDDKIFSEKYDELRINQKGLNANDLIEIPAFRNIMPNVKNKKITLGKRKILQYSLNGEFLKEFESAAAAAREIEPEKDCNRLAHKFYKCVKVIGRVVVVIFGNTER